jgi:hypothetical protein
MAFLNNVINPRYSSLHFWDDLVSNWGGDTWSGYLNRNTRRLLLTSPYLDAGPGYVARVKADLEKKFFASELYWLIMVNDRGQGIYESQSLPAREMKTSYHAYVSMDYRRVKTVWLCMMKNSKGVRLEGKVRLPFQCVQRPNGRFTVEVQMQTPSCARKQRDLFLTITRSLKERVAVEQRSSHGFTET